MEKILSYIEDTYAPAALFVYGSCLLYTSPSPRDTR